MIDRLCAAFCAVLLVSCGEQHPITTEDGAPIEIEVSNLRPLDDDALRALLRGASTRSASNHLGQRFDCNGGLTTFLGGTPIQGEYDISNGRVCTLSGCQHIYEADGHYYSVADSETDRAQLFEITHVLPCPPDAQD